MSNRDESLLGGDVRLWSLIEQRAAPGADKKAIDARIWDLFGEQWCVMFTDLSGFSRKVAQFGITHFLQVIHEQKKLLLPIVSARDGVLIKVEGDSFLIIFRRPQSALRCAVEMQHATVAYNQSRPPEEHVLLCLGIGYGKVLRIGDQDVWGAEVNAASKLGEDTAGSGEILVTEGFKAGLESESGFTFERLTETIPGTDAAYRVGYATA